jgi:ATP-binding cassette, subfamily B (MDR/TAP), member 1
MGIAFGIAIGGIVTIVGHHFNFGFANTRFTKRLRELMFNSMLQQEVGWHDLDENRSSILATRLATSVSLSKGLTTDVLSLYCQAIAGVGVLVTVELVLNWKLALVLMAFIPVTYGGGIVNSKATMNTNQGGKSTVEEGGRLTTECVENIKTVVSLSRAKFFDRQFGDIFNRKCKSSLAMLHLQALAYGLRNSMLLFIQAAAFAYGYVLIRDNK